VRRFTAEYLETTREGMWADSRATLADLRLADRDSVLDVGAGTGELTRVLREEVPGTVPALDADPALLTRVGGPAVVGDATQLPFAADSVDLVVCQALLINLPEPLAAVEEFARVAADTVAVIEPDNSAVTVESTVDAEPSLLRRARRRYLRGVDTDVALGDAGALFEQSHLSDITVSRYDHERAIEPPYSSRALEGARRKASGAGLEADRGTILAGDTTPEEFDALRQEWREVGRSVVAQMQAGTYRQREVVPFYVTVGECEDG